MSPFKILKTYYWITLASGLLFTLPLSHWVRLDEVGARGAFVLILCWNVLFMMLLPLVLDWAERRYLNARFMALEEVASSNPQLAEVLRERCKKMSIPGLKLVVIESQLEELVSYGIWKSNPRIIVPTILLEEGNEQQAITSVEQELARFSRREHDVVYLLFAAIQALLLVLLVWAF